MVIPALLSLILYLLASLVAIRQVLDGGRPASLLAALAWSALALHGATLADEILTLGPGQNLTLLNVASAVGLLTGVLMTLGARRLNAWILLPAVYGFAALLQLASGLLPSRYLIHLEQRPELMLHIVFALLAFALLMMASLFSLLLAGLQHHLKVRKRLSLPGLPPLLTVERRVFQLIQVGLALLTASIAIGMLFFFHEMFAPGQRLKAILAMVAWLVYAALLWGHARLGWRGRILIGLSLAGSLLLVLAYFGSRFLNEVFPG